MPDVGLNFSPTQQGANNMQRPGQGASPVMDAIRILSFRVPSVLGANAPVGPGLLAGPGGAGPSGTDNSAMILNWLNRFFGQGFQKHMPVPLQTPGAPPEQTPGGAPQPEPPNGGRPAVIFRQQGMQNAPPPPPQSGPGTGMGGFNAPSMGPEIHNPF